MIRFRFGFTSFDLEAKLGVALGESRRYGED